MDLSLTVNGRVNHLEIDDLKEKLMFILRERLGLTGTKNGCASGHCGTCVVMMNGEAVKSCLIQARKLQGAVILTVEGISPQFPTDNLHPVQQALVNTTGVQCGFCTPGIVMELYVLFEKNPNATNIDIIESLEGHLCRCTGYTPILDGAKIVQKLILEEANKST